MNIREKLVQETKEEYANLIHNEKQNHFHQATSGITPESYYNSLLDDVLDEISKGTFDNCLSGKEIMHKVAADKTLIYRANK